MLWSYEIGGWWCYLCTGVMLRLLYEIGNWHCYEPYCIIHLSTTWWKEGAHKKKKEKKSASYVFKCTRWDSLKCLGLCYLIIWWSWRNWIWVGIYMSCWWLLLGVVLCSPDFISTTLALKFSHPCSMSLTPLLAIEEKSSWMLFCMFLRLWNV